MHVYVYICLPQFQRKDVNGMCIYIFFITLRLLEFLGIVLPDTGYPVDDTFQVYMLRYQAEVEYSFIIGLLFQMNHFCLQAFVGQHIMMFQQ